LVSKLRGDQPAWKGLSDLIIKDRELLKPLGRGRAELKMSGEHEGLFLGSQKKI